jgi:hypothetical protein
MPRQEQSGGDDSVNIQAGQNATVHIGVTASEARDIALDVFRANFLELRGHAEEVARDRADRITREFIEALRTRNPEGLASIQDPDMQLSIYNAQKGYACSGEEDLEAALVDLLVDRAGQTIRNRKTLVLNQAIECLPRLTAEQRTAVAISFLVRHTQYSGPLVLALFYDYISTNLVPFADISSVKMIDCQYAQAAGVGSVGTFSKLALEDAFWQRYCGYLLKGFTVDQAEAQLRTRSLEDDQVSAYITDRSIFIPCIRNPEKLQINAVSLEDVKNVQAAKGLAGNPGSAGPLETLCLHGRMTDPEIREDIASHIPPMSKLFDAWDSSGLGQFELTAVGIAIGHAYWRRINDTAPSVDTWI